MIYSNDCARIQVPGACYFQVPDWPQKGQCGAFCYNEASQLVETPHILFIEWDGGVRDVSMWRKEFLNYDYVGAPWPPRLWGRGGPHPGLTVGNGGFTLWSKRLMDHIAANRNRFMISTDTHISVNHRRALEAEGGFKWAPENVAYDFAFEYGLPASREHNFGFHGAFNWPYMLPRADMLERIHLMIASEYVASTVMLDRLFQNDPNLMDEISPDDRDIVIKIMKRPVRRTIRAPVMRNPNIAQPPVRPAHIPNIVQMRRGTKA
jgi:hypothetical protein